MLQLAIPLVLIIIYLYTVGGAIRFHQTYNPWVIGDWLINYQGGFVRRGLMGESVLNIARMLDVSPGAVVVVFQSFAYAVVFFFVWRLLRFQKTLIPHVFLLFSPFIFAFQLHDPIGGYRKEILFFAVMAFLVWLARQPSKQWFERGFYIVLAAYPILILTHEMLAIWLPYLIIVYIYTMPLTQKRVFILSGMVSLSIIAFAASIIGAGDQHVADAINLSLHPYGYSNPYGAVAFLGIDTYKAFTSTWVTAKNNAYIIYYPQIIALSLLAFIPVRKNLAIVFASPWAKPLAMVSLVGTILIGLVGVDWGRFIYTSIMPLFLLSLLVESRPSRDFYSTKKVGLFVLVLLIYAGGWYIPHAGQPFPYRWPII